MRSDTQAISIDASPSKVLELVANPENLPRWAVGFARSVRRDSEGWAVTTAGGEVRLKVEANAAAGTVDFLISPAPGVQALAASRVLPRGAGSEYVFTQFQAPGMPDEAFGKSVAALVHELKVVKALAEVECPL